MTTLTKKMAEDLTDYLKELGVKVQYLHSEVDTLERVAILRDLRLGVFDVLVGINLLREGIDLPEVTLVAILDADKEGFLRSAWSLIQMIGRAARNIGGEVVMYADRVTESMQVAIDETDRRRAIQEAYNLEHGHRADDHRQGASTTSTSGSASVAESTIVYTSEREGGELSTRPTGPRSRPWSPGWRRRCGPQPRSSSSSGPRPSATRSSRSACASSSRTPRSSSGAPPSVPGDRRQGTARGLDNAAAERARATWRGEPRRPARRSRSPASRSCRPTRNRPPTSTANRRRRREDTHRRLAARDPRRAR